MINYRMLIVNLSHVDNFIIRLNMAILSIVAYRGLVERCYSYVVAFPAMAYTHGMGSINAQLAGRKVAETIRRGKKVNMGQILKEVGYAKHVTLHPDRVTDTKSFQTSLNVERKSIVEELDKEIARLQSAIARKNLDHEEYRTLVGALDISVKNKQLLSGGATERQIFILPSEVMARHAIVERKPDELPPNTSSNTPALPSGTSSDSPAPSPDVPPQP